MSKVRDVEPEGFKFWCETGGPVRGSRQKYYNDIVLTHQGDECLIWPFAKNGGGYPQIAVNGRMKDLHRIICKNVNGDPPTDKHEAAHTCGNKACVNQSHLKWKTPIENAADKYLHGTIMFGERNASAKITWEDVRKIRENSGSLTVGELAMTYGLSQAQISRIRNNTRWVEAA